MCIVVNDEFYPAVPVDLKGIETQQVYFPNLADVPARVDVVAEAHARVGGVNLANINQPPVLVERGRTVQKQRADRQGRRA
jgi:hypothetical protein